MNDNTLFSIQQITKNNKTHYIHKKTKKKLPTNSQFVKKLKNTIKIPPAYKNVVIARNLNSKILAKGEDAKGRIQYIYNPDYVEERNTEKFKELIPFSKKIHNIRKWMNKTLQDYRKSKQFTKNTLIACCLYLIDACNFRVGNSKYYDLYDSSGVTTLCPSHINGTPSEVTIEFKGKKGVQNKSIITNKTINELLLNLKYTNKNETFLFCYKDDTINKKICINEKTINLFLKSYHPSLSVKMYRTWNANVDFINHIKPFLQQLDISLPQSKLEKTIKKGILQTIRKIAPDYHHSAAISRKSYLHEGLIHYIITNPIEATQKITQIRATKTDPSNHKHIMDLLLLVSN